MDPMSPDNDIWYANILPNFTILKNIILTGKYFVDTIIQYSNDLAFHNRMHLEIQFLSLFTEDDRYRS